MKKRKTSDFKRSIKALAVQEGWLVEIGDRKGPTERLVIFTKEGGKTVRIATIILRADQKEIKPIVARKTLRGLQQRMIKEVAEAAAEESVREALQVLIDWLKAWF